MFDKMIKKISDIYLAYKIKGYLRNQYESVKLRNIFKEKYSIEIGMYSYGCFDINRIPRGTKIGRYCSFAPQVRIFNGNHGLKFISLHPYLYNPSLGLVTSEKIDRYSCIIEDDVWFGFGAILTPSATYIGRGAVIAAGSVVTKPVPRYAIVAGNPAKVIRYRFPDEVVDKIENSEWWNKSKDELKLSIDNEPEFMFNPEN